MYERPYQKNNVSIALIDVLHSLTITMADNNNNNLMERRTMRNTNHFTRFLVVLFSLWLMDDRKTSSFGLFNEGLGRTAYSASSTTSSTSSPSIASAGVEAWSSTSSFQRNPQHSKHSQQSTTLSCNDRQRYLNNPPTTFLNLLLAAPSASKASRAASSSSCSSSSSSLFSTSTPSVDETESESLQSESVTNTNTNSTSSVDESLIIFETEQQKLIHDFCVGTNNFWKQLVIEPVRDYVEIRNGPSSTTTNRQADDDDDDSSRGIDMDAILSKLIAPPELPGISRPVWFTILGSVPTALGWYGYYKFCVEEELFQYELQSNKPVTGCGGYGTLFPFVYGVLIGFPLSLIPVDGSDILLKAAAFWILAGQVNLYRRVNELCTRSSSSSSSSDIDIDIDGRVAAEMEKLYSDKLNNDPPLYEWWALLPPPLDVVVGLRQVHFLSEYWRIQRDEPYDKDVVAEELFPFISEPRFTLKEFVRTPSMWFWFTKDWEDFEFEFIRD